MIFHECCVISFCKMDILTTGNVWETIGKLWAWKHWVLENEIKVSWFSTILLADFFLYFFPRILASEVGFSQKVLLWKDVKKSTSCVFLTSWGSNVYKSIRSLVGSTSNSNFIMKKQKFIFRPQRISLEKLFVYQNMYQ